MSVKASPISRTASILIVVIGAFVLLTGLLAGVLANVVAGVSFIVLGVALYLLLARFTKKLRAEISGDPA